MNDYALHPLFLHFKDDNLEQTFLFENDLKMIIFYRIGIYLTAITATVGAIGYSFLYPQYWQVFAFTVGMILLPFFTFVIVIFHYKQYWNYYQRLVALANFLGPAVVIFLYMGPFKNDYSVVAVAFSLFILIGHFILRIRFKIALLVTVFYTGLAQILMMIKGNYIPLDMMHVSIGFWPTLLAANLGGYFLERSTRKSFVQKLIIQQQQEALEQEQQKSERLLLNILPEEIAARLKSKEEDIIADSFPNISVLFADIVNFTSMSNNMTPKGIVGFLNELFVLYDDLTEKYGLEKIKTIGDAYMVGAGIPVPEEGHADKILSFSIAMLKATQDFNQKLGKQISIRVGIHSGPAVAGVIGTKKFLYDLWGDTVNTASRMESSGVGDKIQVTADTYQLTRDRFDFEERGAIDIKGKGKMITYFLIGKKA